jgi:peptidoglycan-N-acetylmuramic acid deacetylase
VEVLMKKFLVPLLLLSMLVVNVTKTYFDGGIFPVSNITKEGEILRWGLSKRADGRPPDVNPGSSDLLKKYNSFYIGDTTKKVIYLTFDEGYENGYTPKILDVLMENKVKAVFFITGHFFNQNQNLIKRMIDEGHEVGNHTMLHKSLPEISDSAVKKEIKDLDDAIYNTYGIHTKYFRAPKGEYSERTLHISNEMGYKNIFWSFAYEDWIIEKKRGMEFALNSVMKYLHNGEIMLLHAVSEDNALALDRIIKDVRLKGYEFGNLDDLCLKVPVNTGIGSELQNLSEEVLE